MKLLLCYFTFFCIIHIGSSLMCYQCSPGMPGCNPFNWRGMGYLGSHCPEDNDICVKLIEKRGAEELVTRDCLSSFQGIRTDIPADKYEGCRTSSPDNLLAHYVNNSIKEYDVRRNYYETTWCFCFLDHRCNGSSVAMLSSTLALTALVLNFLTKIL